MKNGKNTIKYVFITGVLAVVLSVVFSFTVFAEPDETYAIESYVATSSTSAEAETTVETEASEPQDNEPENNENGDNTEPAETTQSEEAVEETSAEAVTTEATEPSYRAPLPTVEDTQIQVPTAIGSDVENEPSLFWGFVSWILIGVGAAVIFAVVLSTKAKAYRGGRDRYSATDKISGKKKLLPQDYYDKRKRR